MKLFIRNIRILSSIVLFFFLWSFGPLFQIPTAIAADNKAPGKQTAGDASQKPISSGERFEKALESIRENIDRSEKKTDRGEDDKAEREYIRSKRAEIDLIDVELRKEFSETEKKLKSAKLPKEILDRHAKFVKHYEDNLAELKTNLDGHEKAQNAQDKIKARDHLKKAKLHLEKTKAPSRHQKLDPNNLPFRNRKEAKPIAPRLKKEEFEKDFPKQRSKGAIRTAGIRDAELIGWTRIIDSALLRVTSPLTPNASRNLLAYNGPASDMPLQLPLPSGESIEVRGGFDTQLPDFVFSDVNPQSEIYNPQWMVAQATTDRPTADDLAQTPEVQFTPEIVAKAQELGGSPVKIYEWVRNNIEYAPTYGSIQGADQCLQSKICNDMDTASLLIALLRTSGIAAKYQYATVEIPIEKAMNWVGGVTDPKMVGTIFATNGVPVTLMKNSSGVYKAVQLEHVFVQAFIDYIPSRGAVHKQGDTWIPLDPSFKQYNYTLGIDIKTAVPFDAQIYANQIQSTAITSTGDGSVTNYDSAAAQSGLSDYASSLSTFISQNMPNTTVGDIIGRKEIIQQNYPILLGTLPYRTVQAGPEYSQIPDSLRMMVNFSISDPSGLSNGLLFTTSLPQLAGEKITLSFSPATASDQAVVESYLPYPHADGTAIQLSELPISLPAYLIDLKPELKISGHIVAIGSVVSMGTQQQFSVSFSVPGIGVNNISNNIYSGEYYAIGLDSGRIGNSKFTNLKSNIENTWSKLAAQNIGGFTKDEIVGDILYATITHYFSELDMMDEITAKTMDVVRYRLPSFGMFSLSMQTSDVFGIPVNARSDSMLMDVDGIMQAVFSKDGDMRRVKQYMLSSGLMSSTFEHAVPERLFSTSDNVAQGISAVKAITIANSQGIPIYTINQSNVNLILSQLHIDAEAITDIQNAVNAGKEAVVPQRNIALGDWLGCGYIIFDPVSGAGGYMISGGANGMKIVAGLLLVLSLIFFILAVMTAVPTGGVGAVIFGWLGIMALYGMNIALSGKQKADKFNKCLSQAILVHFVWDVFFEHKFGKLGVIGSLLFTSYELKGCVQDLQAMDPIIIDPLNLNLV